jgi:hypothetical protein
MVWYCLFISLYELDNILEYNLLIICRYLKFVKKYAGKVDREIEKKTFQPHQHFEQIMGNIICYFR